MIQFSYPEALKERANICIQYTKVLLLLRQATITQVWLVIFCTLGPRQASLSQIPPLADWVSVM